MDESELLCSRPIASRYHSRAEQVVHEPARPDTGDGRGSRGRLCKRQLNDGIAKKSPANPCLTPDVSPGYRTDTPTVIGWAAACWTTFIVRGVKTAT
jgi:hypothetical protein